jgi:hypothetical protein
MKKLFFLFISTCLYFTGHAQDELNKSESEIRELSGDFQVEENSDSINADGVYKTIIYMNKSSDDEDNHNKGVWEYVLRNDSCIATYFYPADDAVDAAMNDYLDTTAIKAGKDLWNKDDGKIMIVHQEMDDKTTRYLFFIF